MRTFTDEINCTQEFTDEIGELRAISGHVLRATGIQIPEDDLDDMQSLLLTQIESELSCFLRFCTTADP
ncbi:hypothetical protein Tco_1186978, partial [Tanacetum coccineum]